MCGYVFSKAAGYELDTYEYEEGDIKGPFTIALAIDTNGGGQIVWFSASDFLDDMYNAYSSGADVALTMNAVSSLLGERKAISIRSKSFNYNYQTISEHILVSELNEVGERVWYDGENVLTSSEETEAAEEHEALDISGIEAALLNLTADSFADELPTMLADVHTVRTYINAYDSRQHTMGALVDKLLTGPEAFTGIDPIDSFCGLWDTRI